MNIIEIKATDEELKELKQKYKVIDVYNVKKSKGNGETSDKINRYIVKYFNIDYETYQKAVRGKQIYSDAKHLARYFIKKHCKLSLDDIGAKTGGKEHGAVLHSLKVIKTMIDPKFGDTGFIKVFKELDKVFDKMFLA